MEFKRFIVWHSLCDSVLSKRFGLQDSETWVTSDPQFGEVQIVFDPAKEGVVMQNDGLTSLEKQY
jgi:hypothetical protein